MPGPQSVEGSAITPDRDYAERTAWRATSTPSTPEKTISDDSTPVARPAQTCSFFKLPAELRTYIYDLVLTGDDEWVEISTTFQQQPLLSACLQIHSEAAVIYYKKHSFWADVTDGNPRVLNAWSTNTAASAILGLDVYVFLPGDLEGYDEYSFGGWGEVDQLCWRELLRWCLQVWSGVDGVRTIAAANEMCAKEKLVCGMLKFAKEMREFGDWSLCRWYLENMAIMALKWADVDFARYRFTGGSYWYTQVIQKRRSAITYSDADGDPNKWLWYRDPWKVGDFGDEQLLPCGESYE